MNMLWIFYDEYYQHIDMSTIQSDSLIIGNDVKHTVTIRNFPFAEGPLTITEVEHGFVISTEDGRIISQAVKGEVLELKQQNETLKILLTSSELSRETYYVGNQQEVRISAVDQTAHIWKAAITDLYEKQSFSLYKETGEWLIDSNKQDLYINGERKSGNNHVKIGEWLFIPFMMIRFIEDDVIEVISMEECVINLPVMAVPQSVMRKKYPSYRRTPRMIYDLPEEKVSLSFPSQEADVSNRGLWLIIMPPLVMLIVMGVVALIQPRGIFIIITMVMFMTTLVTSSVQYFKDRSNQKRKKEKRYKVYTLYLENKRKELQELAEKQRHVLNFHFPSFERMKYFTNEVSDRIWERTLESDDFLQFRLGIGTVPSSYEIALNSSDMANREMDDLVEQSQLLEKVYKEIDRVPVVANLSEGSIGLIGKERVVKSEIHQMIGQLSFFHSYHDLRFVFIFDEKEYRDWEWVKWLPHFKLPHLHARGLIYNDQTRDQLLSSIYELIRERDLEEDKEQLKFSPHIVFIITNQQLISDHVILEYLEGKHADLGISVIFAAESKENLTDNIHTLVRYINDYEGDILIQKKKAVSIPFILDAHQKDSNEPYARMLRTLDHQIGMTNSIPQSVSFLEMMNVKEVEKLPIAEYWLTKESAKSLAVPIGLKGKEDYVYLNLHEKAHGPHGLLAGTTGSGKSEFLQSYILSLAVHFHPHEVAFLLIDYKGGGMAQPFKNMPHLLGTITNIEGSKNFSARALASIRSELKRRQRLFDQYKVNHINDYTGLYKRKMAEEPLPHLFLISDEFAELKSEEPEFIRELVSAARIGRSLGVHLILATQKPGGVIDEQIWSNARFKVALKVQDANDSKEILKNADAASITVTGRGYLQVGNNEVYELFQSAWSGAPYLEDHSEAEDEVAFVTDLGLIPLSDVTANDSKKKDSITEIEAVVGRIETLQKELAINKLNSPWLPPLGERLSRKDYISIEKDEISFALIDEPEKQSQKPHHYNVIEGGNIGIFGSSGYGKSYTVMTLLLSMAERYSPEEVHYYLMDFGNGTLLPLRQLPHTADFFSMDDERKIEKFMRILKDEISRRKQLLQEYEVSSIKLFNSISEQKLPIIFIAVENYDFIKEEMQDIEPFINQFIRDGQSLGIYMILTATRVTSIRQALMNNLKMKVVHYLLDHSEAFSILGRTEFSPEPVPGRAIIKRDEAYFSQVFLPSEGRNDLEVLDSVKENIRSIKERYEGYQCPEPIPMLPTDLTTLNFTQFIDARQDDWRIPIGLDEEFVKPVDINMENSKHCIVMGQGQKGKTNVLKVLLNTVLERGIDTVGLFDSFDRGLSSYADVEGISYIETKEQITEWITQAEERLSMREAEYMEGIQQGKISLRFDPIMLVIDGYARFSQALDSQLQERMAKLMRNYSHLGFNVIAAGSSNDLSKGYDSLTTEIKQIRQALLLMKKSDQTLFTLPYDRKEAEINPGFGYYVTNGKEIKIKIPLCTSERKIFS
ncbi:type VII secretion protein EssC [Cytobacillus purgationiresistens]|uniref:S-DNA-T family DNA segregation ATPase FtsK/SpoIIIE n=1 Tax=Cytobacillus purgationiresistens TaxID=863449 RepID=A0ABU0APV0_9BACI|nr:type VII secretion protein EssC [Cytobacillus purgationiresistens]MDQ0273312.1 S-DNA-T family DNA segregation ATPase FtsK/SpoIIIE [Cytobacillus purgationiresistens]